MTTELLTDPGHVRGDLVAMTAHVRTRPIEIAPAVIDAMPKVAGILLLKGKPREQLAAGRLLLAMLEYNRTLNPPVPAQPGSTTINVGVQVDNRTDDRRDRTRAIAERVRAARLLEQSPG